MLHSPRYEISKSNACKRKSPSIDVDRSCHVADAYQTRQLKTALRCPVYESLDGKPYPTSCAQS